MKIAQCYLNVIIKLQNYKNNKNFIFYHTQKIK